MQSPTAFAERADRNAIETGNAFAPKFGDDGLIPVVTQDSTSGEVLMVAYMNDEALRLTVESGAVVYWSRSRN